MRKKTKSNPESKVVNNGDESSEFTFHVYRNFYDEKCLLIGGCSASVRTGISNAMDEDKLMKVLDPVMDNIGRKLLETSEDGKCKSNAMDVKAEPIDSSTKSKAFKPPKMKKTYVPMPTQQQKNLVHYLKHTLGLDKTELANMSNGKSTNEMNQAEIGAVIAKLKKMKPKGETPS